MFNLTIFSTADGREEQAKPESLLAVPLVPTQQAVGALACIIVGLLQAHLGVLDIGEGDPEDQDSPGIAVGKVQPF